MKSKAKRRLLLLVLLFALGIVFVISGYFGKYPIPFSAYIQALINFGQSDTPLNLQRIQTILLNIRWPRIILAVLIGAGISVSGATYQALFQNPMVSQDILGASQGAAFGAALGLFFNQAYEIIVLWSFLLGLTAVLLVLFLERLIRGHSKLNLILIGMIISSLFSSAVSFLKLIGDPTNTLPAITYWLMGSLSGIKPQDVYYAAPLLLIGMLPLLLLRWRLNVISLGNEEAASLGINIRLLRLIMITAATLVTAVAVSVSGMIGWVGLVVPHFARLLLGNNYRYTLPATALGGGIFLLLVDDCARLLTTSEIPIGILTSVIGAPVFLILIAQNSQPERS
uniref:Vitamin B12 ABC transporter, permease component BtuC n=1 Tax=Loigolactobacillus rennini TaxID=238013 RepID=A0A1K2IB65_9LACO|nr:Vitamin B12 ABC transporter, permease component BtuC [Loigolactobacillus rennini]